MKVIINNSILILLAIILQLLISCGDDNSNNSKPIDPTAPNITSLEKNKYVYGDNVRITGNNFGSSKAKVFFAPGIEVTGSKITQWNDSVIRVYIPDGAIAGNIYVERADGVKGNEYPINIITNDIYPMILIKKGSFTMGDDASDNPFEKPAHKVTITNDLYFAMTEVTQKQYITTTSKNPFVTKGDNIAANYIYFKDAVEFCNKLSKKSGLDTCYTINGSSIHCDFNKNGYRLPTEAEWEYAAKAGSTTDFGTGEYAWYANTSGGAGGGTPKEVMKLKANAWGLYDMNGNVSEWVWDNYSGSYYQECVGDVTDPTGSSDFGGSKVIRGGNYQSDISKIKSTSREGFNIYDNNYTIGFRFVRKK
jgi:formylglycine-generating enzyme required for sulfatase activity